MPVCHRGKPFRLTNPKKASRAFRVTHNPKFFCIALLPTLLRCSTCSTGHADHQSPIPRARPIQILWRGQIHRLEAYPRSILELARHLFPKDARTQYREDHIRTQDAAQLGISDLDHLPRLMFRLC